MSRITDYHLQSQYDTIVTIIRELAPPGLTEAWGVVVFKGGPDFRLNLGRYRVIEVVPLARHVAVFMEWRQVFRRPEIYADDPDLYLFEDAFGYLGVNDNWNQPWNVWPETDLSDPYVATFLEYGMRLIIKEIRRKHPSTRSSEA